MQCAGKVVSAAAGNNEHRQLQAHQLRQMAMNRSISSEDQNGVGFRRAGGDFSRSSPSRRWLRHACAWEFSTIRVGTAASVCFHSIRSHLERRCGFRWRKPHCSRKIPMASVPAGASQRFFLTLPGPGRQNALRPLDRFHANTEILRLRRAIRNPNRAAALRMTPRRTRAINTGESKVRPSFQFSSFHSLSS